MPQAKPRYPTVEAYLDSDEQLDGRYEYADGELAPLMVESGLNDAIANFLFLYLVTKGFFPFRLVRIHSCEIQVEKFHTNDKQTRLPDLVILRPEHIPLTQRRLSIRLSMSAPQMIAEVVSPYPNENHPNYQEDYIRRPYQYAMRGIPEYWIIDPQRQVVIVQSSLGAGGYAKSEEFQGNDWVKSNLAQLEGLQLSVQEILNPDG